MDDNRILEYFSNLCKEVRENNSLLKEIHSILKKITSKEHIEREDLKAFAINLLADIMVEYKSNELEALFNNISLTK